MTKVQNPLVLLLLDACDWNYCKKYMAMGLMPTLQNLLKDAAFAKLKDDDSVLELGLYNLVVSGKRREELGYYDFRQLIPGTYSLSEELEGEDFGIAPFWEAYKNTDKKVCILDTYDVATLEDLKGIQIARWSVIMVKKEQIVIPESLKEDVPELKTQQILNQIVPSTLKEDVLFYEKILKRIEHRDKVYAKLLKRDIYDFIAIGFGDLHITSHQFFKYQQYNASNTTNKDFLKLSKAVETVFHLVDKSIGKMLQIVPENSNIVVFSPYGIKPIFPFEDFNTKICPLLGYQQSISIPLSQRFSPINIARKLIPVSWRISLSRILLNKIQRNAILNNNFVKNVDWNKTTVFSIPGIFRTYLRVNLKGREPQGIVEERDYDALVDAIIEDLKGFKNAATGKQLYTKILKVKGAYTDTIPFNMPDIIALFDDSDKFVDRISYPGKPDIVQSKNVFFRTNEHTDEGFLIAKGPDISIDGEIKGVAYKDLAPTLVKLAGIENGVDYYGKSIF